MVTVFRDAMRRLRGQVLGWGIGLALVALLLVTMYDSIAENVDQLEGYLEAFPEEFTAFFGDFSTFATAEGFLGVEFFSYMPLILGIFAALMGSGLLVSDEEAGTLDVAVGRIEFHAAELLQVGRLGLDE